jgi:hypothetical protein
VGEIPDLSKLNGKKKPEPEPEAGPPQARTAFLVVVGADGNIQVSADTTQEIEVERPCTTDDIYTAAALICKDIQVQQTAALVSQSLLQMGSMLQQQATDQQLRQRLNLK